MESLNGDNGEVEIVHVKDGARQVQDLDMQCGTDTMCEEIDQLSEENIGTESDDSSVDGENTILLKGKQELSWQ